MHFILIYSLCFLPGLERCGEPGKIGSCSVNTVNSMSLAHFCKPVVLRWLCGTEIEVCCDRWEAAKKSVCSCELLQAAGCDGVLNKGGAYPLDPQRE